MKYFAKQSKMIYCNLYDNVNYAALCGRSQKAKAGWRQEAGVLHINQKWNTKLNSTKLLSLAQKLNHSPIKISQVTGKLRDRQTARHGDR